MRGSWPSNPYRGARGGANTPFLPPKSPTSERSFEPLPHGIFDCSMDSNWKWCEFLKSVNSQMRSFNIGEKRIEKVRAFSELHFPLPSLYLPMSLHCLPPMCHEKIMGHFLRPEVAGNGPEMDRKWTGNGPKIVQKRANMHFLTKNGWNSTAHNCLVAWWN